MPELASPDGMHLTGIWGAAQNRIAERLAIDCEGTVAGPGGQWKANLPEIDNGLWITLKSFANNVMPAIDSRATSRRVAA